MCYLVDNLQKHYNVVLNICEHISIETSDIVAIDIVATLTGTESFPTISSLNMPLILRI